jgi:hypothetical protein
MNGTHLKEERVTLLQTNSNLHFVKFSQLTITVVCLKTVTCKVLEAKARASFNEEANNKRKREIKQKTKKRKGNRVNGETNFCLSMLFLWAATPCRPARR